MSHRIEKFSSTLKQCLGEILVNQIQDPKLQLTSVSEVKVSPDLKRAEVYVSSPEQDMETVMRHLNRARGYFKKQLPGKMSLKYVPELEFRELQTLNTNPNTSEPENQE
jgi:ribosome-binding factor A